MYLAVGGKEGVEGGEGVGAGPPQRRTNPPRVVSVVRGEGCWRGRMSVSQLLRGCNDRAYGLA